MRKIPAILAVLLGVALASPSLAACRALPQMPALNADFGQWLNPARQKSGKSRVAASANLNRLAQEQACDMAARGKLSHEGKGGSLQSRLKRAGVKVTAAVENIARSSRPASVETAARLWLDSPPHRKNLFYPGLKSYGFAVAEANGFYYYAFIGSAAG